MEDQNKLLQDKCNSFEAKCGSLERGMKILIEEQKWEYSAPDIPRSHWVECGFDEEYIGVMECFLSEMMKTTCVLRADKNDDGEANIRK